MTHTVLTLLICAWAAGAIRNSASIVRLDVRIFGRIFHANLQERARPSDKRAQPVTGELHAAAAFTQSSFSEDAAPSCALLNCGERRGSSVTAGSGAGVTPK